MPVKDGSEGGSCDRPYSRALGVGRRGPDDQEQRGMPEARRSRTSLALLDCRSLHADVLVRSHVQIIVTSRCTRTCAGLPPSVAYRRPMMTRDLEISSVSTSTRGRFIDKTRSAGSFAGPT
jgi:hypothetical protein